jgi:uncharacterized protein with GYD domain
MPASRGLIYPFGGITILCFHLGERIIGNITERRWTMPTYIGLYKMTDQGIKNIKDAPSRVEDASKGAEAMGGKVIGVYSVWGEYDYVAIGEFPSDEAAMSFAMALGSGGNVRTTTLKAFTKEELARIVKNLP